VHEEPEKVGLDLSFAISMLALKGMAKPDEVFPWEEPLDERPIREFLAYPSASLIIWLRIFFLSLISGLP